MISINWPGKAPGENLDYSIDWSAALTPGETISTSTWAPPGGIVLGNTAVSGGTISVVWLSEGEMGARYRIVNTITTTAGRVMEAAAYLFVQEP